ncbi:MAG: glycoside hydrolase/phage tail family protein [Henriciella sp.]|uniref:baseplate multidomain protein megatron n=1 Tax=Henriciella sp. TaxID=1968823 RepID=UPI003C715DD0
MGEIILSQVGSAVGAAALPNGLTIAGAQISGAVIGRTIGSLAGRALDSALTPATEGPRLKSLHVMESREGAGMANVYGRMRVAGQLIWASRFKEKKRERRTGKGGPKIADYSYSVSLAAAICEGEITRIDRVWANGESLDLSGLNWRLYKGDEAQLPDPLIEAIEGAGNAPAYRGTAYIVFEDLPLDAFGNRLPQLIFEVVRAGAASDGLRAVVEGVNIIPASGEFVYGTSIVRSRYFPAIETPLNMNNTRGISDFELSLEQLSSDLPQTSHAALTVGWFGDDVRAGSCRTRPGVETRDRVTVPYGWEVAGQKRGEAYLVSQSGGTANYGGTPADRAVVEGIAALRAEGFAITLSPFLLMDVPPGNGLPDPYGGAEQAAFPWRGRITVSADGTEAARSEIDAFLGSDNDFGFRHFILHHARLAVDAGGVDAFLLGSEMAALTRVRDETGAFPFVEGLVQLAADVRAILGPGPEVSYAADWTEYGAYVPDDESGDVLFPLDTLWASPDVDFVGVDWYPPAGDWRDGADHLDALAGYEGADDPDYLLSQMAGGEAYDWYYASAADRDAQVRTPIADTAHGEDWVFRQKDLAGWWSNAHHERPGGVRNSPSTGWTPGQKPVRLMEIGFPAVDKGGNAPNLFYDPKSSESALPPYSSGARDDIFQRRALETALTYWQAQPFIDVAYVWAWDGRPWPDFPSRKNVWSDGPNWAYGHWLNGRTGLISLAETMEDMGLRAGVPLDAGAVSGAIEGYVLDGPVPLRRAFEPLRAVYGLAALEREDGLKLVTEAATAAIAVDAARLAEPGLSLTRTLLDKRPGRLLLSYIDDGGQYAPAQLDARSDLGEAAYTIEAALPLVLAESEAGAIAQRLLSAALEPDTAVVNLPPDYLGIEPGDLVSGVGLSGSWLVSEVMEDGLLRRLSLTRPTGASVQSALEPPSAGDAAIVYPAPELVLIDGPALPGAAGNGPMIAASASPWRGRVAVRAGVDAANLIERATLSTPARIGRLAAGMGAGPLGRWDRANTLLIDLEEGDLASADRLAALSGINMVLVQGVAGWELIAFETADLVGTSQWQLGGLLRGLSGSPVTTAESGGACVIADGALVQAELSAGETGLDLVWQAEGGALLSFAYEDRAGLPWSVAHLRANRSVTGWSVSWLPRGADIPDNLDLPDPVQTRTYLVQAELSGEILYEAELELPMLQLEPAYDLVRIAELGADGRRGAWVSIPLGGS